MINVSSFSGPLGVIWGYDLAPPDDLRGKLWFHVHEDPHDMFTPNPQSPPKVPVCNIEPLLITSQSLFGTVSHRRFPLMAGAHVPCAVKEAYFLDPNTNKPTSGWLWNFLSLVIAENHDTDACSIVEDAGFFANDNSVDATISEKKSGTN